MPTDTNGTAASEVVSRETLVDAARIGWVNRLIDLSRRNNLLYYRQQTSSNLELPITPRFKEFLRGDHVFPIGDLLAHDFNKTSSIRSIARKGLENIEEKGLSTLYLALGKCTWRSDDGGTNPQALVMLLPIEIKLRGQDLAAAEVRIAGDALVNPVLLHVFNKELNVSVDSEAILHRFAAKDDLPGDEHDLNPEHEEASLDEVLRFLNVQAAKVPGFKAEPFAVIGNFSFQKLAMVRDLEKHLSELRSSDVVAAIAGDGAAKRKLTSAQIETDPRELDKVPPDNDFAVVEADSSQQCAISGIACGQSAVVHGPPGTGKSQTITNLIATLIANGKKILFVAEKRAALEVVMSRLAAVDLDHLVIDLHGAEQTPKKVMERVARTLNAVRDAGKPAAALVHEQFTDRRNKLNQHDARMHTTLLPTRKTVFEMQGELLRLPSEINSGLRWRGSDLIQITPEVAERVLDLLHEAGGFESLFNCTDSSPWTGVEFKDGLAVQRALDLSTRLNHETLPTVKDSLDLVSVASGLRPTRTLSAVSELLSALKKTKQILDMYSSEVFAQAPELLDSLLPGQQPGVSGFWYRLTDGSFKAATKRSVALRGARKAPPRVLFQELSKAKEVSKYWVELSCLGITPKVVPEADALEGNYQALVSELRELQQITNANWDGLQISQIGDAVAALAADTQTPYRLSRLNEIERELIVLGVQRLVTEIRMSRKPSAQWPILFRYVWLNSTLDAAAVKDPVIRGFAGAAHNVYVEDFKRLDLKRLQLARERVRRAHAERTIAAMNTYPEQAASIRSEAAKVRRHKPLRKTFAETFDVLSAVCPCWMASPLSVCQLIEQTGKFDYVVFDEASQVLPEDAVPAILRGKHVIVAGDNKQLPPTAFFASGDEDGDEDTDAVAFESLLDMMIPFVKGFHLNWHYRSRDESLITFSNTHVYDDRLVTFPGPGGTAAMSHILVEQRLGADGQEDSCGDEVARVVGLVLQHAQDHSNLTLGVITMGIKHANRIQAVLDERLSGRADLADFFDTSRRERFFVKNLERVQGDERDVIILSVGYGKDRSGNLPLRFGPILSASGRRRLNVAVTRAKQQMIVVSSFAYSDIDSRKVRPESGLEFLKNYLLYASSGGKLLSRGELTNEPMNAFEADVYEALTSKGVHLVPQVGCSQFRIDLAASHPSKPGRFVLAIECDGASYHSAYTARDRDRLRQQQLENLGWKFHRIWSTDWFMRRDEELERARAAFESAVATSDGQQSGLVPEISVNLPNFEANTSALSLRSPALAPIPVRSSISEYSGQELQSLLEWVKSDGKLRTNEELMDEMFAALPFNRRGSKIEAALKKAVAAS